MDDTKRGDASDPYEIIITDQDTPQPSGHGYKHTQPMTYARMTLNASHLRRIDRACVSINVGRQDVIRALIRQALDGEGGAVIITGWGTSVRI